MSYTIGEVARMMGIAPSALRYYEKEGLLALGPRGSGGERKFSEEDLTRLSVIECLRFHEFSIRDIREFLGWLDQEESADSLQARYEIFQKEAQSVRAEIEELQKRLERLEFGCWYYETAQRLGSVKPLYDYKDEDFCPQHLRVIRESDTLPLTFARKKIRW